MAAMAAIAPVDVVGDGAGRWRCWARALAILEAPANVGRGAKFGRSSILGLCRRRFFATPPNFLDRASFRARLELLLRFIWIR
jgi:hypothetical protein